MHTGRLRLPGPVSGDGKRCRDRLRRFLRLERLLQLGPATSAATRTASAVSTVTNHGIVAAGYACRMQVPSEPSATAGA
jgi:hypothetical protein